MSILIISKKPFFPTLILNQMRGFINDKFFTGGKIFYIIEEFGIPDEKAIGQSESSVALVCKY